MTTLCKLAQKYGTDKYPWYTPFYDLLLSDSREYVRTVLEIGIGTVPTMGHVQDYKPGASLRMWRDYFPDAWIFGWDIDSSVLFNDDRIFTTRCDQSNQLELNKALLSSGVLQHVFDVIIDDGSHEPAHQILTAKTLVPYLSAGGIYIIEDVNNFDEVSPYLPFGHTCIQTRYADLTGRAIVIQAEEK